MHCRNEVVVITGASMGIGEALAGLFVSEGARVIMSSRELARLEEARARVGSPEQTAAIVCDVRDRQQVEALVGAAKDRFGRIDVWINNAGYGMLDSVTTMSMEECRRMFDTNLFGAIDCMQAVVPFFKAKASGTIINISSVVGYLPVPHMGAYSATKHALNAISEAARLELEASGIRVISACPGRVQTNFAANTKMGSEGKRLGEHLQKGISPQRCARAILRGYLRGSREIFVPWHGWLVTRLYELCPGLVEFGMRRMMASR